MRRYLDTGDAKSMSNLRKHAKICWGEEAVAAADNTKNVGAAREALGKMRLVNGSITAAFERTSKGKITYSHHQHTTTEARYVPSAPIIPCYPEYDGPIVLRLFVGSPKTSVPSRL